MEKGPGLFRCQCPAINQAVCFPDLIEHFGERRGDIQVVIQSLKKSIGFCESELRIWNSVPCNIVQTSNPFVDPKQGLACFAESIKGEVQRQSVINSNKGVAEFATGKTFVQQIAQRKKVTERFRHLLSFDEKMSVMHPVADKSSSVDAFGLGNLRFGVWEYIIDAAAMDIDFRSEDSVCHGAAFNMPPRPSFAPWGFPTYRPILLVPSLPQSEVPNMLFFVLVILDATGWSQFRQVEMRQLTVVGIFADPKID